MSNKWINALKMWNNKNENWCVPKKGSKDYEKVKKLMNKKEEPKKQEPKKQEPKKQETKKNSWDGTYSTNIFNEKYVMEKNKNKPIGIYTGDLKSWREERKEADKILRQQRNQHRREVRKLLRGKGAEGGGTIDWEKELKEEEEAAKRHAEMRKKMMKKKKSGVLF